MDGQPHPRLMRRLENVRRDRFEYFARKQYAVLREAAGKLDDAARATGDPDMRRLSIATFKLSEVLEHLGQSEQHFVTMSSDVKRMADQLNAAIRAWHDQWSAKISGPKTV